MKPRYVATPPLLGLLGLIGAAVGLGACGLSGEGTDTEGTVQEGGRDAIGSANGEGGQAGDGSPATDSTTEEGADESSAALDGPADGSMTLDSPGLEGDITADASSDGAEEGSPAQDVGAPEGGDAAEAGPGPDAGPPQDAGADVADGGRTGADAGPADSGGPTDAAADHQDAGAGGDASDAGTCDFDGTWASRLTIDVSWAPQGLTGIILASGSGQIKQWIKGVRVQSGTTTSDSTVVCGIDLPDFQETAIAGGETYGVRFPSSLFDTLPAFLPTFTVDAALSGLSPGSTYSTTTTAVLIGLSMAHPTTDPWPSTITTEVDMDKDMKPGVTVDTAQGSPYSDVPVALPAPFQQPPRADRLYIAIRQVTVVTATVVDCDHMTGTISIPQISSKYAIDSHVMGCRLDSDGGPDCTTTSTLGSSQAAFVDNTQPVFTPSGTTDFHSVRLATGATCAEVRAALP